MSEIPIIQRDGPAHWKLSLPDWEEIDTVRKDSAPFALWPVGEQALLFHWLDAAVDQGTEKVELLVTDRPLEIRQEINNASLWPIVIDVRCVSTTEHASADDRVDRLPGTVPLSKEPANGWELLEHWFQIEQEWLKNFTKETAQYGHFAAVGKFCEIAKDVKFIPPYWVGNFVSIGPGSTIGPSAVIEDGCVLAGEHEISEAHLSAHTYLAPHTELKQAALHGSTLYNFRHKARVSGLEAFLATGVQLPERPFTTRPTIKERWFALRLLLRLAKHGYTSETKFIDLQGHPRPLLQDHSPQARGPWLKEVLAGRMSLFGITPRPESAVSSLPLDWQNVIRKAPTGAFSYADVVDAPDVGSEEEAMHCVFQTSTPGMHCRELFDAWIQKIK